MGDNKKPKPKVPDKADDKEQSERFIETARTHETDEASNSLDDAFKRLIPIKPKAAHRR